MRVSGDADISVQAGGSLVFSPANWSVPQAVTIAAGRDGDRLNGQAIIRSTAPGPAACEIAAIELDNTPLYIIVEPGAVVVPEGGTTTFNVRLNAEPTTDLSVSIARDGGDSDLSVSPAVLTFTRQNWHVNQAVTVTAAEDADGANGFASIRCSAVEAMPASISAFEQDNDSQQILLESASVTVPEGGQGELRLRLAIPPDANVVVTPTLGDGDRDILLATSSVVFTKTNWNAWQVVRLTAADDLDIENGTNGLALNAPGVPEVTATITERDNDRQAILCSTSLAVPENGTVNLAVTLMAQPVANVTVTAEVVSGDEDLYIMAGNSLVFTSENWHINHMVTIAAREDADKVAGTASLRLLSPGIDTLTVSLTEQDNDPNQAPTVRDAAVTVAHNSAQIVHLQGEDADLHPAALTYVIVAQPAHGVIQRFDKHTGEVVYMPDADYAGADAFTFKASDGVLDSPAARVSITVQPAPVTPPVDPPDDSGNPIPGDDDDDNDNPGTGDNDDDDDTGNNGDGPGDNTSPPPSDRDNSIDDPAVIAPMPCGAGLMTVMPMLVAGLFVTRRSARHVRRG
jgi:hypothetical protein